MPEDEDVKIIKLREEPLVNVLHTIIRYCVKLLAILMIVVIIASIVDVIYILYDKLVITQPIGYFHVEGILAILGAFIAVLIAIEVFHNIIVYLHEDTLHVKLVLSTALIAVSRKVIVLDYSTTSPAHIYAIAAVVVATAGAYWIVACREKKPEDRR